MGHWAEIDENDVVIRVLVMKEEELDTGNWGDKSNWIKTSYNTHEGKHYVPNEHQNWSEESPDQSKALRYRFAGAGYFYNRTHDVFMTTPKPFPSWIVDTSNYTWVPPHNPDALSETQRSQGYYYTWDEDAYQADNTAGWVLRQTDDQQPFDDTTL